MDPPAAELKGFFSGPSRGDDPFVLLGIQTFLLRLDVSFKIDDGFFGP